MSEDTQPQPENKPVERHYVFPDTLYDEGVSNMILRRNLSQVSSVGRPEVSRYYVTMTFMPADLAEREDEIDQQVVQVVKDTAKSDTNLFPSVQNEDDIPNIPALPTYELPRFTEDGTPIVDWPKAGAPSDEVVIDVADPEATRVIIDLLVNFCRLTSSTQLRQPLIFLANKSEASSNALEDMLDEFKTVATTSYPSQDEQLTALSYMAPAIYEVAELTRDWPPMEGFVPEPGVVAVMMDMFRNSLSGPTA